MRSHCPGRQAERATEYNWEGYAWRKTEDLRWDEGVKGVGGETYEVDAKC